MNARYNLDSYWAFYWDYLGNATSINWILGRENARPFDLGPSLKHQDWTVNEILADQLPVSITLGITAIILALAIGPHRGRDRRHEAGIAARFHNTHHRPGGDQPALLRHRHRAARAVLGVLEDLSHRPAGVASRISFCPR